MNRFMNELEAGQLLSAVGVHMVKSCLCQTVEEAEAHAAELPFPIVMKVLSSDILHKTDASCVYIGVADTAEMIETWHLIMKNAKSYAPQAMIEGILLQEMAPKGLEVIVGMKRDPQFGPVLLAGLGGIYVEIYNDVSMRLIPVSRTDVENMFRETSLDQILNGARGRTYDREALIEVFLHISDYLTEHPEIIELEINPLFVYEQHKGVMGVDALIHTEDSLK